MWTTRPTASVAPKRRAAHRGAEEHDARAVATSLGASMRPASARKPRISERAGGDAVRPHELRASFRAHQPGAERHVGGGALDAVEPLQAIEVDGARARRGAASRWPTRRAGDASREEKDRALPDLVELAVEVGFEAVDGREQEDQHRDAPHHAEAGEREAQRVGAEAPQALAQDVGGRHLIPS